MHRHIAILALVSLCFLVAGPVSSSPAGAQELTGLFEEVREGILGQIDDFAVGSCDPPCPGLICCDNSVCVHSVLACGFYPIQIDSFRVHGSPRAQMAGFATQGILAAELGREARLWFGRLDGEAWSQLGIEPGVYEIVLLEGATREHAVVEIVGRDGEPVARLNDHFWVFYGATTNVEASATEPDWTLSADRLQFEACNLGRCVRLGFDLPVE